MKTTNYSSFITSYSFHFILTCVPGIICSILLAIAIRDIGIAVLMESQDLLFIPDRNIPGLQHGIEESLGLYALGVTLLIYFSCVAYTSYKHSKMK
jgi:hypothetical protein